MARLSKAELLDVIAAAVKEGGWNLLYLDINHPFRLQIYDEQRSYRTRVYIWNITHGGGRERPAHEYRIQITGVDRFEPEPNGTTLILGWWDPIGVFAGFDFNRHSGPLGASPSLQIREECLRQAYTSGFAPCLKENREIAIAFRPDFLVEYITNLLPLHAFGESPQDLATLEEVANDPNSVNDADLQVVTPQRQIVVKAVQQRLRSSSFKTRVLTAYNRSCAFCGLQLDLIQAAHVVPVSHHASTDETHNGIAACFLHHAAYDRALITFDESYQVLVNEEQMKDFIRIRRNGGMSQFRAALRPLLLLPPAVSDRPHVDLVRLGNQVRGWS
jgi:putative restriction endonuclease